MTYYIEGSVRDFDYAGQIVFIDKIVWGDPSYKQLKESFFKKVDGDKALRYGYSFYTNLNSFSTVNYSELKGKMKNRLSYILDDSTVDNLINNIKEYKGFSFFIPFDLFKKIYNLVNSYIVSYERKELLSFDNLFVFDSKMTQEDINWIRLLGLENGDHLNEFTIQKNQVMNLRLIYSNEKENYDSEKLIEWISTKFKVQRPTIQKIINNEIFNEEEVVGLEAWLQKDFLPTMLKDINFSIVDFEEDRDECYTNLNQSLSEVILYEMDRADLLQQIAIFIENKKGQI